jgi:hypothetical protein
VRKIAKFMLVTLRINLASPPSALNVTTFVFFVVEDFFLIGANGPRGRT